MVFVLDLPPLHVGSVLLFSRFLHNLLNVLWLPSPNLTGRPTEGVSNLQMLQYKLSYHDLKSQFVMFSPFPLPPPTDWGCIVMQRPSLSQL